MYRVEQILIAVDFSRFSHTALVLGRRFQASEREGGEVSLELVHAVPRIDRYMREILFPYAALGADDRAIEAELMEAAQGHLGEYFDPAEQPHLAMGAAHEVILGQARELEASLIVMGAFGEGGVWPSGLGSTSRRVVASATRPVALVRDGGGQSRVRRILAAVDLSRHSRAVVEVAVEVAAGFGASLDILHVVPSPEPTDTGWMIEREVGVKRSQVLEEVAPQARALLEELVGGLEIPLARREVVEQVMGDKVVGVGEPGAEIVETAHDEDYDLVVIGRGTRDHHGGVGPGGVASAVMVEAAAHVVIVPARHDDTPLERWGGMSLDY